MSSTTTRPQRSIVWGILCTLAGWAAFAVSFAFGVALLALSAYGISMQQSSGKFGWGLIFFMIGIGMAMLGMLISPVLAGIAVVKGGRTRWRNVIIFAVPAIIGAVYIYIVLLLNR